MKKGFSPVRALLLSTLFLGLNPLLLPVYSGEVSDESNDRTILLDTSAIRGERLGKDRDQDFLKKREDLPALSTALRWEGDEITALDIPKEILEQLTQPDLSYILGQSSDLDEID